MWAFSPPFLSSHDQRQSAGESSVVSRREDPVWADAAARWLVSDGGGGGGGLRGGLWWGLCRRCYTSQLAIETCLYLTSSPSHLFYKPSCKHTGNIIVIIVIERLY